MATGRPRLVDVAALAGVSQKTVSNVLNDHPHVTTSTRLKVESALAELDYRVNLSARSLASGRTGFIAVALPSLANPYFAQLSGQIIRAAAAHRWTVLIEETGGSDEAESQVVDGAIPYLVDGIILHPDSAAPTPSSAATGRTPLVVIGERLQHGVADHVAGDAVRAGYDLARHLIERGRRRIALVGIEEGARFTASALRYEGAVRAMTEAGLAVEPDLVIRVDDYSRADGVAAADRLLALSPRPDAALCFNDLLAVGVLNRLHGARVAVPDEIAVAGFDDIDEAGFTLPSLTTIAWNTAALAEQAVELLWTRMHDRDLPERQVAVDYELLVREST